MVEWWGLPTRLEWALLGYQTGSSARRMAFGRLRWPWLQELKSSAFMQLSAGRSRPAAEVVAGPWGDSPWALRGHLVKSGSLHRLRLAVPLEECGGL